jgi:hypothetical protein
LHLQIIEELLRAYRYRLLIPSLPRNLLAFPSVTVSFKPQAFDLAYWSLEG